MTFCIRYFKDCGEVVWEVGWLWSLLKKSLKLIPLLLLTRFWGNFTTLRGIVMHRTITNKTPKSFKTELHKTLYQIPCRNEDNMLEYSSSSPDLEHKLWLCLVLLYAFSISRGSRSVPRERAICRLLPEQWEEESTLQKEERLYHRQRRWHQVWDWYGHVL